MAIGDSTAPISTSNLSALSSLSTGLALGGAAMGAIGAFYSAKANQYALRGQASALEFQGSLAALNARAAAVDADLILEAGRQEAGASALRYRAAGGELAVEQASSGVQRGVGSAAENAASLRLAEQLDAYSITTNTARAVAAARVHGIDAMTASAIARSNAAGLRGAASSISPGLAGATSLIGSAGQIGGQWAQNQRQQQLYARISGG